MQLRSTSLQYGLAEHTTPKHNMNHSLSTAAGSWNTSSPSETKLGQASRINQGLEESDRGCFRKVQSMQLSLRWSRKPVSKMRRWFGAWGLVSFYTQCCQKTCAVLMGKLPDSSHAQDVELQQSCYRSINNCLGWKGIEVPRNELKGEHLLSFRYGVPARLSVTCFREVSRINLSLGEPPKSASHAKFNIASETENGEKKIYRNRIE